MFTRSLCYLILLFCAKPVLSQTLSSSESFIYVCPLCARDCDTIRFTKAGLCPDCGMTLGKISLEAFEARLKNLAARHQKEVTVCFYLQDGVEVLDFAGPMEVFTAAGFKVFTVSRNKSNIRSQDAVSIFPDYDIYSAPPADVIAFFGGATRASVNDTALMSWVRARSEAATYTFSVCTGAFIIGKAGILDNLKATTYHTAIDQLRKTLPRTTVLANVRVVDNGKVIQTAGVSAGTDGALHLVERLRNRDFAKEVAELIEYDKWIPDQGLIINKN